MIRHQLTGVAEVIGSEPDPTRALPRLREVRGSIALLFLDRARESVLSIVKELSRIPGSSPIVVSRDRSSQTILTAMRAGARDFAYLDEKDRDIRRAILNLKEFAQANDLPEGKMIAVFAAKGGSGATTIATNLGGTIIAEAPKARVVIVDLDLQMGDVLVFLDVTSRYGFFDVIRNMHRLDQDLLHQSLATHSSGLQVLAQAMLDDSEDLKGEDLVTVLSFLKRHYDYVILDGLRDFSELALLAMDKSEHIALTMTPDVPALKNAYRCLTVFKQLGYAPEKIKVLLNRFQKQGLDLHSVEDALGRKIDGVVSNDFPTIIGVINRGELLSASAPRARVTRDINSLLPLLSIDIGLSTQRQRRGLLRRLVQ